MKPRKPATPPPQPDVFFQRWAHDDRFGKNVETRLLTGPVVQSFSGDKSLAWELRRKCEEKLRAILEVNE